MVADDVDRIMQVMHGAFDPEYREAWTRRQIEDALLIGNTHYLLACPDGAPIPAGCDADHPVAGFAMARVTLDEEELLLFAVLPQFRRSGIGAKLLDRCAENAKKRGITRILLEVRRGNSAEVLYRRHGFAPIGVRPKYYTTLAGLRIDAITFERRLT